MIPVEYHPDALDELADAACYCESLQTGLGKRLHRLVRQIEAEISEHPETGFIHDHGTRMRLVRKFPYGVIFKSYSNHIFIVAVAHLSRKPGYWRRSLSSSSKEQP